MKIKSINITNFRQFISTGEIEFSHDENKCYTVLLGNNTYGKTTFVKAFTWCLYHEDKFADNKLLNKVVSKRMTTGDEENVTVTLRLNHDNIDYRIKTISTYQKNEDGTFNVTKPRTEVFKTLKNEGNQILNGKEAIEEINKILEYDLKDYFFFDGENNTLTDIGKNSTLKEAVSNMIGLRPMQKLKEYYKPNSSKGIIKALESELKGDDGTATTLIFEAKKAIDNGTKDIEDEVQINKDLRKEIQEFEAQIRINEAELDTNKTLIEKQDRKKAIDKENIKLNDNVNGSYDNIIESINNRNSLFYSLLSVANKKNDVEEYLNSSTFATGSGLSDINEKAVDQLILRGYCLCGSCLKTNTKLKEKLLEEKNHMEPNNYAKYIENYKTSDNMNCQRAQKLYKELDYNTNELYESWDKFNENEDELVDIKRIIAGKKDIGYLQKQNNENEIQIGIKTNTIQYSESTLIPKLEKEVEKARDQLRKATENNAENEIINKAIKYAENIYKVLDKELSVKEEEKRNLLEEVVDSIFEDMYHGIDKNKPDNNKIEIKINKDFNVKIFVDDEVIDPSTGEDTVKNFAFVAGLSKLLLEKKPDDIYEENRDGNYPLVMDAPFSSLDEIHIENVCLKLPEFCKQVITVVMEKDFSKVQEKIGDKIGKIYKIEKVSEIEAKIDEYEEV